MNTPTSLLLRCGALLLSAAFALPVLAQQTPSPAPSTAAADGQAPKKGLRDRPGCIRDTGTLIANRDGHCLNVPGRSYDQNDIRNTGATTVGGALDKLDPSISVRGARW